MSLAALVVTVDQITKAAVAAVLGLSGANAKVDLFGSWIAIEYTRNRGAAFGLFSGMASLLAIGSILVVVFLAVQYVRSSQPPFWYSLALGAILGGAIGNLLDRLRFGYVVDFVEIGPWPNFNFADSAITLGVLTLIWHWAREGAGHGSHEIGDLSV